MHLLGPIKADNLISTAIKKPGFVPPRKGSVWRPCRPCYTGKRYPEETCRTTESWAHPDRTNRPVILSTLRNSDATKLMNRAISSIPTNTTTAQSLVLGGTSPQQPSPQVLHVCTPVLRKPGSQNSSSGPGSRKEPHGSSSYFTSRALTYSLPALRSYLTNPT